MLISQAKYAKYRGITRQAVNEAVKAGRITLVNGKVDPVAADQQWDSRSGCGSVQVVGLPPYAESKQARAAYEAKLSELELAKAEGRYIDIDVARADIESRIVRCRARLVSLPAKLAPLVVGVEDLNELRGIIERVVYEALAELANAGNEEDVPEIAA